MPDAVSTDPNPIKSGIARAVADAQKAAGGGGDRPPQLVGTIQQPASPIGVPYYHIDPTTGQPATDAQGNSMRWRPDTTPNTTTDQGQLVHGGGWGAMPRYFDGDQWLPASLPPDQLAVLQKSMVAAGLLKPGQAQLGVWDQASMGAYTQLLAYANANGSDVSTALQHWGQAHTTDSGDIRQPLTVKVTNPDDLRKVFRQTVIDTLGQGWDTDKIDRMVQAYQGVETAAQQQQYAMTGSGSQTDPGQGGTVTAPPSPQAFAETQARQDNPTGAQEHDSLGFINSFNQLVGKWGG